MLPLGLSLFDSSGNVYFVGEPVHLHPAVAHRVLLAARRNHPADVTRCAAPGEIRALHHDTRHIQVGTRGHKTYWYKLIKPILPAFFGVTNFGNLGRKLKFGKF